jgi:hypothetical protein
MWTHPRRERFSGEDGEYFAHHGPRRRHCDFRVHLRHGELADRLDATFADSWRIIDMGRLRDVDTVAAR